MLTFQLYQSQCKFLLNQSKLMMVQPDLFSQICPPIRFWRLCQCQHRSLELCHGQSLSRSYRGSCKMYLCPLDELSHSHQGLHSQRLLKTTKRLIKETLIIHSNNLLISCTMIIHHPLCLRS